MHLTLIPVIWFRLASEKHHIAPEKQSRSFIVSKIFWVSMPPDTSSCMVCLCTHYAPDHSQPDGYGPAVCCIRDWNVYFEFFLEAKTFLRPNFTTRTTNIQILELKLTNLKKHANIKNCMLLYDKPPILADLEDCWCKHSNEKRNLTIAESLQNPPQNAAHYHQSSQTN